MLQLSLQYVTAPISEKSGHVAGGCIIQVIAICNASKRVISNQGVLKWRGHILQGPLYNPLNILCISMVGYLPS